MEEQNKSLERKDLERLSHELTYRRYMMDRGKVRSLFKNIRIPEYIALYSIAQDSENSSIYGERTYLQELSEKMQLSMRQTSKMVGDLRDRGLVTWSHDGNGKDGTYVTITESGKQLLENQETIVKEFYGRVIDSFGKENLIHLLHQMKELETVMTREIEQMEENGELED
ncbi:MAG: MarR family transcriptional regulator [Eubacterium sp.]|nr:MarR family transcriptional regulator [Eubacterium sp.]